MMPPVEVPAMRSKFFARGLQAALDHVFTRGGRKLHLKDCDPPVVIPATYLNQFWRTVARSAAGVRPLYHLLQSLRSLATGWCVEPDQTLWLLLMMLPSK
jgi:hypothetical protein